MSPTPTFRDNNPLMETRGSIEGDFSEIWAVGKLNNEHAKTTVESEEPFIVNTYYGKGASTYVSDIIEDYIEQLDDEGSLQKGNFYFCYGYCGDYPYYYVLIVGYESYGRMVEWYDYIIYNGGGVEIALPDKKVVPGIGMTKTFRDLILKVQSSAGQVAMSKGLGSLSLLGRNTVYSINARAKQRFSSTAGTTLPWFAYLIFFEDREMSGRYTRPSFFSPISLILASHAMQSPAGLAIKRSSFTCVGELLDAKAIPPGYSSYASTRFSGKGGTTNYVIYYNSFGFSDCIIMYDLPVWASFHTWMLMNEMYPMT